MATMATKASPPPPWKAMLPKCALEIFGFFLLCLPLAYIYVFARPHEPFQRGFFCDDESLKHPYVEDQVSTAACFLTWVTLSALVILPVELLRTGGRCEAGIRAAVVELYQVSGPYILGALSCMVATDSAKFSVGRLRPHFLTLCRPDFNRTGLCRDSWGYHRFVTEPDSDICQGLQMNLTTSKQLHDARLSFLSGHASFSFHCASFLVLYLQARLATFPIRNGRAVRILHRMLKVLRPFLQLGLILLAFWISLTRVSDYFHHPEDVITGSVFGILFALFTFIFVSKLGTKNPQNNAIGLQI